MTLQKRTTIHDVAREAGVSIGTVSRVINNAANVEIKLAQRVMAVIRALNYHPDIGARSMRSKQTNIVGVLMPDFQNPLASAAVAGIEEELSNFGYTIILANSRYDLAREERVLSEFMQRRVDGIIAMIASDQDAASTQRLKLLRTPLVLVERETELELDTVRTNQYDGAYRATRYLIGMGHRRISLVSVPLSTFSGRARLAGYRAAFADAELQVDEKLVNTGGYRHDYSLDASYVALAHANRPTAIIASGGLLGGVLEAARQLHMTIPDQLSIITLGDTDLAAMTTPAITAVSYDWTQAGKVAGLLMIERIARGANAPVSRVVPYQFTIRQSCCPPSGARP
jgi:LacI family transcriptional regulator